MDTNLLIKNFLFIVYITGEWQTYHRKPMFEKMAEFTRESCVFLIVNRPVDWIISPFYHFEKWQERCWDNGLDRVSSNLYMYTPKIYLHDQIALKLRPVVICNRKTLKKQLMNIIKQIESENKKRIIWHMHPDMIDYLDIISGDIKVYDCYDEFCYTLDNKFRKDVFEREKKLLKSVDITFTTSEQLRKNKTIFQPNTHYVQNATDYELLSRAMAPGIEILPRLKKIKRPIIGYLGAIKSVLDTDLLAYIAKNNQQWSIVLIGPKEDKTVIEKLKEIPNIYFISRQPYENFPNILKGFDVAIIPFILNYYTKSINPNKIHEYMAAGCQIVSTALPELYNYKEFIKIAHNKEEVELFITEYLEHPLSYKQRKVQTEYAKQNSWENRFKDMFSLMLR